MSGPVPPADVHAETVGAAIEKAAENPAEALTVEVFQALAALKSSPETTGLYLELVAKLHGANKEVLRRREIEASVATYLPKPNAAPAPVADEEADEIRDGIEPWPDPVDGAALADEIATIIDRHCWLPPGGTTAVTLWALGAYSIDAFRLFPKLLIRSPQPRCGKSTLVEVVETVTPRALLASNISAAAVFRCIEAWHPTLLIDEADTFLAGNEDMRGILNSGHTKRTARVIRVEGESEREPRSFSTWAPTLIAMIGDAPLTIADRSVTVTLARKTREETVERLPRDLYGSLVDLRRRGQRWAKDAAELIEQADPTVPEIGSDRAEDNWRTLLAVADTLGEAWPAKARQALRVLEAEAGGGEDDLSIELLRDLRDIMAGRPGGTSFPSSTLVPLLNDLEERPWPTIAHGKELTARKLANLLRPYGVTSRTVKTGKGRGAGTARGYPREDIEGACARYLPPLDPPVSDTPTHPADSVALSDFPSDTPSEGVSDKKRLRASNGAGCVGVSDREGGRPDVLPETAPIAGRAVL